MPTITKHKLEDAYTYESYFDLMSQLVEAGKTSGPKQSEDLAHYTALNHRRMKRILKTTKLLPETIETLKAIDTPQIWLVITEAWCGDAAQIVPILERMAEENPLIEMRLILRDENLPIMDQYLTGTSRSIPKLVILKADDLTELGVWGPRPEEAHEIVLNAKQQPDYHYTKVTEALQVWYNKYKTIGSQKEVVEVQK
ncbi:MAG: thioredoxin family protein, partial [Bacteroidota bacterium]